MTHRSSSRTREPEVIVFEEPRFVDVKRGREAAKEREKFLAGDVSEIFRTKKYEGERDGREKLGEDRIDFKATLREVQTLGASTLTGKERRKFEREQIIALGGKEPKPPRMPYPLYQRVVKARREKEKRLEDELRLTQMTSRRKKGEPRKIKGKGRWKDNMTSLKPPVGKFKSGVLKLSKEDIGKINRRKHH